MASLISFDHLVLYHNHWISNSLNHWIYLCYSHLYLNLLLLLTIKPFAYLNLNLAHLLLPSPHYIAHLIDFTLHLNCLLKEFELIIKYFFRLTLYFLSKFHHFFDFVAFHLNLFCYFHLITCFLYFFTLQLVRLIIFWDYFLC